MGNSMSAEYWQYDARLGRRWNIDPIPYPWQSTYAAFNNNPIIFADPLGLEGEVGRAVEAVGKFFKAIGNKIRDMFKDSFGKQKHTTYKRDGGRVSKEKSMPGRDRARRSFNWHQNKKPKVGTEQAGMTKDYSRRVAEHTNGNVSAQEFADRYMNRVITIVVRRLSAPFANDKAGWMSWQPVQNTWYHFRVAGGNFVLIGGSPATDLNLQVNSLNALVEVVIDKASDEGMQDACEEFDVTIQINATENQNFDGVYQIEAVHHGDKIPLRYFRPRFGKWSISKWWRKNYIFKEVDQNGNPVGDDIFKKYK